MKKYFIFLLFEILACTRQRSSECSTVFAGEQIRKFVTDRPDEFVSLPRSKDIYNIVPDQSAGVYSIELVVGGKKIFMVADTGSSNVIIDPKEFAADPTKFTNQDFYVSYGSGSGLASKYVDNVSLTCGNIKFEYTVGVLKQNKNLPSILGLAYSSIAQPGPPQTPIPPFFDQVVEKNNGDILNLFSMALCGHKNGDKISLGGPLPGVKQEDLIYVPVIHQSWYVIDARWMQVLDWVKIGNDWQPKAGAVTKVGDFQAFLADKDDGYGEGVTTIVDSGTTMNIFPPEIYSNALAVLRAASAQKALGIPTNFWDALAGNDNYSLAVSHEVIAQLPKFQIVVRGQGDQLVNLDLLPDVYLKKLNKNKDQRTSSFRLSSGHNILGQAFMEGYYVEFDRQSTPNRIGFGKNDIFCKEP